MYYEYECSKYSTKQISAIHLNTEVAVIVSTILLEGQRVLVSFRVPCKKCQRSASKNRHGERLTHFVDTNSWTNDYMTHFLRCD
jgi:threonine dehydrogenase-like Zn-dependent dehydrogenase